MFISRTFTRDVCDLTHGVNRVYPAKHVYVIVRFANKHPWLSQSEIRTHSETTTTPLYVAVKHGSESRLLSVIYASN